MHERSQAFWEHYCEDREGHINPPAEGETPYHQMHIEALANRLRLAFDQWLRSHPKACALIVDEAIKSFTVAVLADDVRGMTHNAGQAEEQVDMLMTDVREMLRAELGLPIDPERRPV
jgi:hypothetical protein